MSYVYEKEKMYLFTDEGQKFFIKVRDTAKRMLEQTGAFRWEELSSQVGGGFDTFQLSACVDRMIELGELEVWDRQSWGQYKIYAGPKRHNLQRYVGANVVATWKSSRFHRYRDCSGDGTGQVTWEYQTTADILTLRFDETESNSFGATFPPCMVETLYSPDQAKAVMFTLLDWDAVYNDGRAHKRWVEERNK